MILRIALWVLEWWSCRDLCIAVVDSVYQGRDLRFHCDIHVDCITLNFGIVLSCRCFLDMCYLNRSLKIPKIIVYRVILCHIHCLRCTGYTKRFCCACTPTCMYLIATVTDIYFVFRPLILIVKIVKKLPMQWYPKKRSRLNSEMSGCLTVDTVWYWCQQHWYT